MIIEHLADRMGYMHIHFVCSGNSYRSRLAEAYCKSITQEKDLLVSSSGTEAEAETTKLGNGPICWYAMRLMKKNKLIPYMSWHEQQTTQEILRGVDLLVCMRPAHLAFCQSLGYAGKFEVLDIPDLNEMPGFIPSSVPGVATDVQQIELTEQTYEKITQKVDELVARFAN